MRSACQRPRRSLLGLPLVAILLLWALPSAAVAEIPCPNPIPVVDENNCAGEGSSSWLFQNYEEAIAGFPTQTSFDLGEDVPLKIARNSGAKTEVDVDVYRMGWYGGAGARLVHSAEDVDVNNDFDCNSPNATTGELSCANWKVTYTIPDEELPASGVYTAKLTTVDGPAIDNQIVFVVRDDEREPESQLLFVLPTASYQAYNTWGGKSLYFDRLGGPTTVSGTGRAVKVSFDRPLWGNDNERDRFLGPDFDLLYWLEREGYDVSYTDDVAVHREGAELLQHEVLVIPGHSEYWSEEQFDAFEAARDAGVSIASFSANTAYWKVRYENGERTLVCYKTVQGDGSGGSGGVSANDWGPDGVEGTSDDALGLDGLSETKDDHPENSTTTFRDDGAPPKDPNAPKGGRVGPDRPENSLFGVMYVGDNDSENFPLTIPAGDLEEQFAADRIWRNTGISENVSTSVGSNLVGWEWDAVPTQAQYLAHQPEDVTLLSASNVQVAGDNSWLLDEGRLRATFPPSGQPGTVNAVKYTAESDAIVFAAGTMHWALGLDSESDPRIEQATYNVLSDMAVQPATPSEDLTLDPAGANAAPKASFTLSPNPVGYNTNVTFNGSATKDPDGTIAKYEWDLDGNGSFETDTGTTATVTKQYKADEVLNVRLRVTDNGGAKDVTVRTLTVIGNIPPVASFTAEPNPVIQGLAVELDASASSDADGTIAKYEWDLDGNGSFETSTGSTATTSTSYPNVSTVQVGLRVTDNGGKTATKTVPIVVSLAGVSSYSDAVLDTPGLIHYWRLGEKAGSTFADLVGGSNATAFGSPELGVSGGVGGDPDLAARFDGINDNAKASVDLSGEHAITVEFWLNWQSYDNNDALALELTNNFNQNDGGFIVDPNAPQAGGSFGIGIGRGESRNNTYFERPSAGKWHHYAFVLDGNAPASEQIVPYVDGKAVTYAKGELGKGAGTFADATLNLMSRGGEGLLGRGDLDELAIYDRALSAETIAEHQASFGTNRRPEADFDVEPNPADTEETVSFDASDADDSDGSIESYEWDLDGNGSFETDTGTTPTASAKYAKEGEVQVRLRVTDDLTGTDTTARTLKIGEQPPQAVIAAQPNPAIVDLGIAFDASESSDSDGSIVKYEWDLDGNGSFETDTGTKASAVQSYDAVGGVEVRLRVTDDDELTATKTLPVTVNSGGVSNYGDAVLDTPGLVGYWRLGEEAGPTLADSAGAASGTASAGAVFGIAGAVAKDPSTAVSFDGNDDSASAPLDLSGTAQATVEFWLKWSKYDNEDDLAMELTPNFNANEGGFLVDPNASQGSFGIGIGSGESRNNAFFTRPSAGQWHHYAIVLDSEAAASEQIVPYVDGKAVTYSKGVSGTGAGKFAKSTLYFMSRAGEALFGAGTLDEVAVYDRALGAGRIGEHYASNGTNKRPQAALSASPNPVAEHEEVTLDGSESSDPDGTIVKYQWDLDGNGSFETDTGTTPTASSEYPEEGEIEIGLRVLDDDFATDVATETLVIGEEPPPGPTYSEVVEETAGLLHYWRFEEGSGTTLADSAGEATASAGGGVSLGASGAPGTDLAAIFDGGNDFAQAAIDLSGTAQATFEFWLKWSKYDDEDDLAMELTPNFNANEGGFLVDPNASQGSFGIGIGSGESRNNAFFTRPSAGQWHHYAIVLDSEAAASEQIVPYVDGKAVTYSKGVSGTGAGKFAKSTLYFMSRAGEALFGAGTLDELAIYDDTLTSVQIAAHFEAATE